MLLFEAILEASARHVEAAHPQKKSSRLCVQARATDVVMID